MDSNPLKRPLNPALAAWLQGFNELLRQLELDGFVPTPKTARDGLAKLTAGLTSRIPELASVMNLSAESPAGSIPLRLYRAEPDQVCAPLVYLHGGGHMAGSIEVYDPICRKLASASGRIVVSVDYRLAPEHPYPSGLDDAEAVLRQLYALFDAHSIAYEARLALAGDSGGGAMTATLAHRLQDDPEIDIEQQILIYPSLDYTMQQASIDENGQGYLLQADRIGWYFDSYLQAGEDRRAVSPLYMEFTPALPETLLVTAAWDPLRDEGLAYLERLARAGVVHRHLHFAEQMHAFLNMEDLTARACDEFYRVAAGFLR